jgi:excinuclease ABC subunit C
MSHTQYREAVNAAIAFLKGGSAETLRDLTAQMDAASQALDFEKAARLRDTIRAIRRMTDKQKVVSTGVKRQDVFAVVRGGIDAGDEGEKACMAVLRFQQGSLRDSEHFIFENPEDMPASRHELLRSFYMMRDDIPRRLPLTARWKTRAYRALVSEKAVRTVRLKIPIRAVRRSWSLVSLQRRGKNSPSYRKNGKVHRALDELARLLSLPHRRRSSRPMTSPTPRGVTMSRVWSCSKAEAV